MSTHLPALLYMSMLHVHFYSSPNMPSVCWVVIVAVLDDTGTGTCPTEKHGVVGQIFDRLLDCHNRVEMMQNSKAFYSMRIVKPAWVYTIACHNTSHPSINTQHTQPT